MERTDFSFTTFFPSPLKTHIRRRELPPRHFLLRDGEPADCLYFVRKGRLKVYKDLPNGRTVTFRFYGPGDFLGDLEFFTRETTTAQVETMVNTEILSVPYHLIDRNKEALARLLFELGKSVAFKMKANSMTIAMNRSYPLKERLITYLVFQEKQQRKNPTYFARNLQELSELLATSYRHLGRVLRELEDQGVLVRTRGGIDLIPSALPEQNASVEWIL